MGEKARKGNSMIHRRGLGLLCAMVLAVGCVKDVEDTGDPKDTAVTSVSLTLGETVVVVDTNQYGSASFPRIFDDGAGGFHVFFHGIGAEWDGEGPPTDYADFAVVPLDADLNATGEATVLSLSSKPGDLAMAKVGDDYFHLTGYAPGWLLAKLDQDFNTVAEVSIEHTSFDRANDMVLNYTHGNLYMMSLYGENMGASPELVDPIYGHLFVYDTSLNEVQPPKVLDDVELLAWGGSIQYQEEQFHLFTADGTHPTESNVLSVYHFDQDWNYLNATQLAEDGQWPQGVVYDQGVYYVAYHEGSHGTGDVVVTAFSENWEPLDSVHVTSNGGDGNAFRPWLIKVGSTLYVSFDDVRFGEGDRPPLLAKVARIAIEAE